MKVRVNEKDIYPGAMIVIPNGVDMRTIEIEIVKEETLEDVYHNKKFFPSKELAQIADDYYKERFDKVRNDKDEQICNACLDHIRKAMFNK